MMSGYVEGRRAGAPRARRVYRVISRDRGWSIALGEACTRPFRDREAAARIARRLQSQADRLNRPLVSH